MIRFDVVGVYEVLGGDVSTSSAGGVFVPAACDGTPETPAFASAVFFAASSRLHAEAGLEACEAVGGNAVDGVVFAEGVFALVDAEVAAVGVFAGEVEEVDAGEDGEEAAEEGDGVDGVGGVEAAEEDEGGDEGAGGEGHVVERVDTGKVKSVRTLVSSPKEWLPYMFVLNWLSALLK